MPQIDLTITISVIVALAAIISPVLTAIINNRHQLKLRKLDLQQRHVENTTLYIRDIFEHYLKYAGRCILHHDTNSRKDYGEYYYLALTYAPEDIRIKMIDANRNFLDDRYDDASRIIEEIAPQIRGMLQTL